METSYILSKANRLYVALEESYGRVPQVNSANRFPAVKLTAHQATQRTERRDKTGSRTFTGLPAGLKRQTTFGLKTYMTAWTNQDTEPGYGPLFRATLGGAPAFFQGGTAAAGSTELNINFSGEHGLSAGQAITFGGELRFVASIPSTSSVILNAPFSQVPQAGEAIGATVCYAPVTELPSVSIFDYWSPGTAVQRILSGVGIDRMRIQVNGDFHEFEFSGVARDIIDSASFSVGDGELSNFPPEPEPESFDYSIVPGNLGQAWLGSTPARFCTLTSAGLLLDNQLDSRNNEFGCILPSGIWGGMRKVMVDLELYELSDEPSKALYQAARQQSPVSVMLQLGQNTGQLFGIYLKSVIPMIPSFDDSDARLQWHFSNSRAQGTVDDEVYIALG